MTIELLVGKIGINANYTISCIDTYQVCVGLYSRDVQYATCLHNRGFSVVTKMFIACKLWNYKLGKFLGTTKTV